MTDPIQQVITRLRRLADVLDAQPTVSLSDVPCQGRTIEEVVHWGAQETREIDCSTCRFMSHIPTSRPAPTTAAPRGTRGCDDCDSPEALVRWPVDDEEEETCREMGHLVVAAYHEGCRMAHADWESSVSRADLERLRDLPRHEHSDASLGDEAAAEIDRLLNLIALHGPAGCGRPEDTLVEGERQRLAAEREAAALRGAAHRLADLVRDAYSEGMADVEDEIQGRRRSRFSAEGGWARSDARAKLERTRGGGDR